MSAHRFHEQVWPLRDRLYRVALRLTGERAEAEDVVQETMIKIWEQRGGLSDINNVEGWCTRLVRNLGIDKIRSRQRRGIADLEKAGDPADMSAGPVRRLQSKDAMDKLERAMATLPEQRRTILQLREIEGYSYREIAETLDISVDQVRTDIHRGRNALRKSLQNCKCYV